VRRRAAREGNFLGLSRSEFGGCLRVPRGVPLTGYLALAASVAGSVLAAHSLPVGSLRQDATVIGRNRGQVLVENLKRAGRSREGSACLRVCKIPGAPASGPHRGSLGKAHEGRAREAGCAPRGDRFGEAKKPMRASALADRGPRRVRTSVGSNALELRGIVISWSSEQEHAMPETAGGHGRRKAYGSTEGKRSVG